MGNLHSPWTVAESFCESNNLEIVNTSIPALSPNYVIVWVAENQLNYDKVIVLQVSPTQFLLWAYGDNGNNAPNEELFATSFDFAEVNTTLTATERAY